MGKNRMEKPKKEPQAKRAINQVKMSAIRQLGNVLLRSLTAFFGGHCY